MKSPADLAARWARQWEVADNREQRLLSADAWPVALSIGRPTASEFAHQTDQVREHVQRWRAVTVGQVIWERVAFRAGSEPVEVPVQWVLDSPSEGVAACGIPDIRREFEFLGTLVAGAPAQFHSLLVRQRQLLLDKSVTEILKAIELSLILARGAAQGKPLRALSLCGVDSKFFERHRQLLVQLLDIRFDGEVSDTGLERFLDAAEDGQHWLLVVPLCEGLLPFAQMRVRASELTANALPGTHLLIVENERCVHQLPELANTVAVLGAGLDLEWVSGAWLGERHVAYWGDLDTWGLWMLAAARCRRPGLTPLLMSREVFEAGSALAVEEGHRVDQPPLEGLTEAERALDEYLRGVERGRLEQEFLPREWVVRALVEWYRETGG